MNKEERIVKRSAHEKEMWGAYFKNKLENKNPHKFSSYWWERYHEQISSFIQEIFPQREGLSVLEAGSGSGKASLLSFGESKITLLDISPYSLNSAKRFAGIVNAKQVEYVEGNMFSMPFADGSFDFVWNVGVVEHYEEDLVIELIREMARVIKPGGFIGIAVPNPRSLAVKKAKIIADPRFKKLLKWVKGYRLDTEKPYLPVDLEKMLNEATSTLGIGFEKATVTYLGSPLFVGTPKMFIKILAWLEKVLKKRRFLVVLTAKRAI